MNEKPRIVYKVVTTNRQGRLSSALVYGQAEVVYAEGLTIMPPDWLAKRGYGICCFDTLERAKEYVRDEITDSRDVIYKASAFGKVTPYLDLPPICEIRRLAEGTIHPCGGKWPYGTVMCEAIILVEKIEQETF